eukprot:2821347-Rhodomonas_salina.1
MSQRFALPQHPRQRLRSLCTYSILTQVKILGQAPEVTRNATITQPRDSLLHQNYAGTVRHQITSKQLANP